MAVMGALLAYYFGLHPAVGAYMAGLILKEEYFYFDNKPNSKDLRDTRRIVDNIAFTWIGPVFFVVLGTQILFDLDILASVIPQVITLTIGIFIVQVASAAIAARYTGGFNFRESMMIGFGMLGRAELCFVVLDIAYVHYEILTEEAFFTLMATAFFLNVSVPISISSPR